ncbi:hypothetical protein ACF1AX_31365 [Streptomyces sp. NPDC014802]|uniref:hypothetical protein n=1 Tax=Streptomyces sp. NPDC014802 TaxID=3364917 RepID=UPI0036F6B300
MIEYVFLGIGTAGTAAVAYAVAPAGSGLHRYVVPRKQLRAEVARAEGTVEELTCKLVALAAELDAVTAQRTDLKAALEKAGQRIASLEEQVRDRHQLRDRVTALEARLANATAVRPLPVKPSPPAAAVPVPLNEAPFALSPAALPS